VANMSYCRFQNTLADLRDCMDALIEADNIQEMNLSAEELNALQRLTALAERFSMYAEELLEEANVEYK